jgi:hypothetical protein
MLIQVVVVHRNNHLQYRRNINCCFYHIVGVSWDYNLQSTTPFGSYYQADRLRHTVSSRSPPAQTYNNQLRMKMNIAQLPMVLLAAVKFVTALTPVYAFMTIYRTGNVLLTPTAPRAGYVLDMLTKDLIYTSALILRDALVETVYRILQVQMGCNQPDFFTHIPPTSN